MLANSNTPFRLLTLTAVKVWRPTACVNGWWAGMEKKTKIPQRPTRQAHSLAARSLHLYKHGYQPPPKCKDYWNTNYNYCYSPASLISNVEQPTIENKKPCSEN